MAKNRKARGPAGGTLALGLSAVGTADTPKSRLFKPLGQTPRYIRWPVFNDDRHVVGHELLRVGPDLDRYLRRMAEESRS